jgi:hypothetical protein
MLTIVSGKGMYGHINKCYDNIPSKYLSRQKNVELRTCRRQITCSDAYDVGLVYKSKEGRKTYYTFASTSECALDLVCCGVLEHFNLTSTIKPLFSFDEWMQRYDIEVG